MALSSYLVVECLAGALTETSWTPTTIQTPESSPFMQRKLRSDLYEPFALQMEAELSDDTHSTWLALHGLECHCQLLVETVRALFLNLD